MLIREKALAIMRDFATLHKGEVPPGSNLGSFVKMVLAPTGLVPPQSYCAATQSYALQDACRELGKPMPIKYTAGALAFFRECQAAGWEIGQEAIQPGDYIIWRRGPVDSGLGHIGIVEFGLNPNGNVQLIEANHGSTVSHFHYDREGWEHNFVGACRIPG